VDPAMRRSWLSAIVLALALVGAGLALLPAVPGARAAASPSSPVTGTLTGPSAAPTSGSATFSVRATGGPAYVGGVQLANLSWYANVTAPNTSGLQVVPSQGTLHGSAPGAFTLTTSNLTQTVTIKVQVTSIYGGESASLNLSDSVPVVTPYLVVANIVVGPSANLLGFSVAIDLDGTLVGTVSVPALSENQTYTLTYRYATAGFSTGWHTFTMSLANEHGLVTFAGGSTDFTQQFYIPGPPPNYAIWYVAGTVAFFGALFILATRVAARRRGAARR